MGGVGLVLDAGNKQKTKKSRSPDTMPAPYVSESTRRSNMAPRGVYCSYTAVHQQRRRLNVSVTLSAA